MSNAMSSRILKLISEKGMSQKELAERACVTQSAMSHYIKGDRTPNSDTLANIATALHTTSDYLLGRESSEIYDYSQIRSILARHANNLSENEKMQLIKALFGGE